MNGVSISRVLLIPRASQRQVVFAAVRFKRLPSVTEGTLAFLPATVPLSPPSLEQRVELCICCARPTALTPSRVSRFPVSDPTWGR